MKKIIRVPVGCEPKISVYRYTNEEFIDYGWGKITIRPTGKLKSLLNHLVSLQKRYRDRYQNMSFDAIHDCGCMSQCSCSPSYILYGERYETDLEYKFRLKKEEKQKEEKLARDRKLYESLKDQFGED